MTNVKCALLEALLKAVKVLHIKIRHISEYSLYQQLSQNFWTDPLPRVKGAVEDADCMLLIPVETVQCHDVWLSGSANH